MFKFHPDSNDFQTLNIPEGERDQKGKSRRERKTKNPKKVSFVSKINSKFLERKDSEEEEESNTSRIDAINATDRSILETDNNLVDDSSSGSASNNDDEGDEER